MIVPGTGLLTRVRRHRAKRLRVAVEDALKHIHAAEEHGRTASVESLAGALGVSTRRAAELVRELHDRGLVAPDLGLVLTPAGRRWARAVVRAHRLWERYLADEVATAATDLHRLADRKEHVLGPEELAELEARLGYPERDPHGDPIPTVAGELRSLAALPVTMLQEGESGEILHLEDEPDSVYARLVAAGLEPGQTVVVRVVSPERVVLGVGPKLCELAPVDAANIFVAQPAIRERAVRTLADLAIGETGEITALRVAGFARRRLLDLGFTPGTPVACEMVSPFGEPRAYRVRGTLIALRPEQARRVEIAPEEATRR